MSIVVRPIDHEFKVIIEHEKEKVELFLKQLDYKTKAHITSLTTSVNKGQVYVDSLLTIFFNIKYGLKRINGLVDEKGSAYKLRFEKGIQTMQGLEDSCVDELLATVFSDNLQYVARELSKSSYPTKVVNPVTGQELKGVEVIPASELKGTKKKS